MASLSNLKVTRAPGAVEVAQEQRCDDPEAKRSTERLLLNMRCLVKEMLGEIEELKEGIKILEGKLAASDQKQQRKLFDEEF
jgi:hypothetical protein